MKRYDAKQTRHATIEAVMCEVFTDEDIGLKRLPMFSTPGRTKGSGLIINVAPAYARSTRESVSAGRGSYRWKDIVAVQALFEVDTDDHEALAEASHRYAHALERAVEHYRYNGMAQVDNDECSIEVFESEIAEQLGGLRVAKDRGAVILTLNTRTTVHWKKQ